MVVISLRLGVSALWSLILIEDQYARELSRFHVARIKIELHLPVEIKA